MASAKLDAVARERIVRPKPEQQGDLQCEQQAS